MSAIFFLEKDFNGDSRIFNVGSYSKNSLRDIFQLSDIVIQSIKVDRNTILLLSSQIYPTQSGDSRVLIGPCEISDIDTLSMRYINSISIIRFRESNWGEGGYVTIFSNHNFSGKEKYLYNGEYNSSRLTMRENNITGINPSEIKSMLININTIVILYSEDNFNENSKSIVIKGPLMLPELSRFNMEGAIKSIRIFSADVIPTNIQKNYNDGWRGDLNPTHRSYIPFTGKTNKERFYNINIDNETGYNACNNTTGYNTGYTTGYNNKLGNIYGTPYMNYGTNMSYSTCIAPKQKNIVTYPILSYLLAGKNTYKICIILLLLLTIIVAITVLIMKFAIHRN
jgi:hypothetical protein